MMLEDLTFQQFCALDYQRNMVVTSGPGAGKTRILSHRFCFILLTDDTVSLPQILTLTFTEKAAEEMKGRIYEMLGQLDRDLHTRPNGDEGLRRKIREAREQFHKNRISTIHSFCANLLREHPVESGIDPGFVIVQGARQRNIMEQAIETGVSLVWENDRDALFPLLESFGGRTRLLRAVRHVMEHPLNFRRVRETSERLFHISGWQPQVFREYCHVIKEESLIPYLEGLRKWEKGEEHVEKVLATLESWQSHEAESDDNSGVPNLFHTLRQMVKERRPKSPKLSIKYGLKEISYVDLVEQFYPDLFSSSPPDDLFEKQLRSFIQVSQVCLECYQSEKKRINALDFADLEAQCHFFLTKLFKGDDPHGLNRVQIRFKYIMVDEFQDTNRVQWEIISLLCSRRDQNGKPVLHPGKLFVVGDKRQAIYKFRGGDVTVFEHGTEGVKQSNQGQQVPMFWQNPEIDDRLRALDPGYPQLLDRHKKAFNGLSQSQREKIQTGDIYLPHNFRTDSRPIEFLNATFDQIFSNKGAEKLKAYETAPMPITMPEGKRSVPGNEGSATFYLTQGSSSRKEQTEREAALIVDIIEGLLGKQGEKNFEYKHYADIRERIERNQLAIGILFFAFTHLKIYENVLREAGLPFKVHRGKGFYQCQEVMEMIQLLNYLADERQHISLMAALRSPIFALTDAEIFDLFYGKQPTLEQFLSSENPSVRSVGQLIRSWRLLSTRLTIAELIRTIISDRYLTAIYSAHPNGMQRLANMEKLIEISRRFQGEGNGALPEFVGYCLEMAEEEEEEGEALLVSEGQSPICLMTVHAAKGLEFPMVIIPDLNRRPPLRTHVGRPVRLYASERGRPGDWNDQEGEIPVWPIEIPELDYRKSFTPLGYLLTRRDRLEDMAENRRVFYVGCSRTMNHLALIGHMGRNMLEKGKGSLSTEDYRERATIMDLLDDIYQFEVNFPREQSSFFEGKGSVPTVIYREPEPKMFKGVQYGGEELTRKQLGDYDEAVKKIDLTEPIRSAPYYQFSFKSMRMFRTCPVMFYYRVILGLKGNGLTVSGSRGEETGVQKDFLEGEDERDYYASKESLYMGNVIHRYLERHCFGDPLDMDLLNNVCGRLAQSDRASDSLHVETLTILREKALKHLETTIHDQQLLRILGVRNEYMEVPFLFTVSEGCEFRGTIDRLVRDGEKGEWVVLDWKSNDLENKDLYQVIEENDYDLQLACYKWAVEHILNEAVGDTYIYFTDGGKLIKSDWEGNPADIVEEMVQAVKKYEADRSQWVQDLGEMKKDVKDCTYCDYERLCKAKE
ncbi:MAG: UvrD-helicase domain-containing protein [Deltaproteobacteria bacterium]|nr:MAG: UvrD-helicase domain-containing protein [Deltaproteobacteria bacterium]